MANRLRGEASFVHEGATLTLLFDAEALLQVEDVTGFGLLALTEGLTRMRVVATMLSVGLARGSNQVISVPDAVEILATNADARDAVIEALNRALPEAPENGARPPKAAGKRGAGKSS